MSALPLKITFVRHGESEANIVQSAQKRNEKFHLEEEIGTRVDWKQRLSKLGREQAEAARRVLLYNYGDMSYFDAHYVSPFIRTRETAMILSGEDSSLRWKVDDRLSERIWGIYGVVTRQEQRSHFPLTSRLANDDPWYIRYDGGESMFDVYNRFKTFKSKLWRKNPSENVLIVAHKQLIQVACYDIEKLLPENWETLDWRNEYLIPNAGIIEYTRVNPSDNNDIRKDFSWKRVIHPFGADEKTYCIDWTEFSAGKTFSSNELKEQIENYPIIIEEDSL